MEHQYNIASATKPKDFEQFTQFLKDCAAPHLTLTSFVVVPGPGCNNYGLALDGPADHAESFARELCMALQPAKYSKLTNDPELKPGRFECTL